MGCNCKGKAPSNLNTNSNIGQTILMYGLKLLMFSLFLLLLPVIVLAITWFAFRTLVLNKEIDIKPLLVSIGKKFKESHDDEDDNEYETLTENDVVMVGVDEIKKK